VERGILAENPRSHPKRRDKAMIVTLAGRVRRSIAARLSTLVEPVRFHSQKLTKDALLLTGLRLLRSPRTQQQIVMDIARRKLAPASDSFEFMCHALAWHKKTRSQLWQDVWVLCQSAFKRGGFFVEVGASDGLTWSNTHLLETAFGWTGVLVEPNPQHRSVLPTNRACRIHYGCVGPRTGEEVEFWATHEPELSGIARYAEQDDHAATRHKHIAHLVTTISLNDLLHECAAPTAIDYISLDTEGSELDILSTFDFDRYDVRLWTIEHGFTRNEAKIDALMRSHGYKRILPEWSLFDAWYARSQHAPAKRVGSAPGNERRFIAPLSTSNMGCDRDRALTAAEEAAAEKHMAQLKPHGVGSERA
jgi:FkbM family methyltransferase